MFKKWLKLASSTVMINYETSAPAVEHGSSVPSGIRKLLTKATKSEIVRELEKHLGEDCSQTPPTSDSAKTGYVVGEFCDSFLRLIQSSAKGASRIDFVFDSYMDKSMKASERQRREKKSPIEVHDVRRETSIPQEMDRFWPSIRNKAKHESLLHQEALAYSWTEPTPDVSNFRIPEGIWHQERRKHY